MSQLADRAVAAHSAVEEQAAATRAAAEQEQLELRAEFTRSYMAIAAPVATEAVAKLFELPADAPMLAELSWRIDPNDFRGVVFARDAEGMAVPQITEGQRNLLGGGQRFQLLADIDVVTIAATEHTVHGEPVARLAVKDMHSSVGISSLSELGAIIQKRRLSLSEQPEASA